MSLCQACHGPFEKWFGFYINSSVKQIGSKSFQEIRTKKKVDDTGQPILTYQHIDTWSGTCCVPVLMCRVTPSCHLLLR